MTRQSSTRVRRIHKFSVTGYPPCFPPLLPKKMYRAMVFFEVHVKGVISTRVVSTAGLHQPVIREGIYRDVCFRHVHGYFLSCNQSNDTKCWRGVFSPLVLGSKEFEVKIPDHPTLFGVAIRSKERRSGVTVSGARLVLNCAAVNHDLNCLCAPVEGTLQS